MDELRAKLDKISLLNRSRYDYVMARADSKNIQAALDKIGYSKQWYYSFKEDERNELEQLAHELHCARVTNAMLILENAAAEAAGVIVDELRSKFGGVRKEAAIEILNRVGVKASEAKDVNLNIRWDGLEKILSVVYDDSTDGGTDPD